MDMDEAGQLRNCLSQVSRKLSQGGILIVVFDVTQDGKKLILFVLNGILPVNAICIILKIEKQQSHGGLSQMTLRILLIQQRPDQIFNQILDGKNVRYFKMHVICASGITPEGIDEKILDDIISLHHGEGSVKKLRKNNEINCNIVDARRKDFLRRMPIQKEEITALQVNPCGVIDNVGGGTAAHVDDLHKIMLVLGKMNKTGMWTDADQLASLQHLFTVYDKFLAGGVKLFFDVLVAV